MGNTRRSRHPSTSSERFVQDFAKRYDVEDPNTWPDNLLPWQLAALRKALTLLEADVAEYDETPRVLDEADTGMPRGRILTGGGQVHTLYKKGGGYVRYLIPSSSTVSCQTVGCCDPRKKVSAGRE
jgi:hypothetical protein